MRVLVTGGAGFIGSHYARFLLGLPRLEVTVLDRITYAGTTDNLPLRDPRLTFVKGDIRDRGLLRELVPGHDALVNFAAESHVDRSIADAGEFVSTNVLGAENLLSAALDGGVRRFVQVSTDEVYGTLESGAWTEESPLLPNSPYAATKAAADLVARSYHRTHGLPVVVTRCSNNYGPAQYPEKLIPRFISHFLDGEEAPLFGDGLHRREWLHVDDHCRGLHLALLDGEPGEVYNIGGGGEFTNREIAERLADLCGADRSLIRAAPDRKGHDRRYALNDAKIRALGYAPRVSLADGLPEVVRWYRRNRDRWTG